MEKLSKKSPYELQELFREVKKNRPHAGMREKQNAGVCTGDYVYRSKNCFFCFDAEQDMEDSKYLSKVGNGIKESYDIYNAGERIEQSYEDAAIGLDTHHILFSMFTWSAYNIFYSSDVSASHDLFGCIGLKNKEYCILNRQYTKEEYEVLLPKIIQDMKDMPYTD